MLIPLSEQATFLIRKKKWKLAIEEDKQSMPLTAVRTGDIVGRQHKDWNYLKMRLGIVFLTFFIRQEFTCLELMTKLSLNYIRFTFYIYRRYKSEKTFMVISNWLRNKDNIQNLSLWENLNSIRI